MTRPLFATIFFLLLPLRTVIAFSTPSPNNGSGNNNAGTIFTLFDRFRPECPANPQSIQTYDPSLLPQDETIADGGDPSPVWVAVFRTSNNAPSVFVKDEFLNAMRLATGGLSELPSSSAVPNDQIETVSSRKTSRTSGKGFGTSQNANKDKDNVDSQASESASTSAGQDSVSAPLLPNTAPVAVARLCPSPDFPGTWTLDNMRCSLKKEDQDEACEGGSEHKEALSVAVDALLLHYLNTQDDDNDDSDNHPRHFEGAIRSKATLVGASLLEERGFQPVQALSKDMATHISSLDSSMEKYAEKYVESMTTKNQGARDRAEKILSLLGRLDRDRDLKAGAATDDEGDDDDDYDPWASMKQFV